MRELDYEKRIADYQASTDVAAVRWRDEVLRALITSARIEKTKCG